MLPKVTNPDIAETSQTIEIFDGISLFVKVLKHRHRSGQSLLFIHGGGAGTNHTIIDRPARWLIDRGLYDRVILPDRRGCGRSSPMTYKMTFSDQARDMQALLDARGETGPLDAMGLSYGGPIALTLAYHDTRIQRVILLASSPSLKGMAFPWNLLMRTGLLSLYMRWLYKREIGKAEPAYVNLDEAYEQTSAKENWQSYRRALNHTPADRLESELLQFEATVDPANAAIPEEIELDVPVLQVIGDRDETWGGMPASYRRRFPNFRQRIVPDAGHKDAIRQADRFLDTLANLLNTERQRKSASDVEGEPAVQLVI